MEENQDKQVQKKFKKDLNTVESFYKLKGPQDLAKVSMNRKKCRKFFLMKKLLINKVKQNYLNLKEYSKLSDIKREEFLNTQHFAQQYSIQEILSKAINSKKIDKNLNKIIRKKMENCVINAEERKKIWILASQAYVNSTMSHFNDYYQNLLNFNDFPDYFKHQIKVDVLRTTSFKPNVKIEAHRASLSNILNNYSKKNSIVGYCQGLNFIASFLLDLDMTEQEAFWTFSQIIEQIMPLDYYPNMMLGLICDLRIFDDLLSVHNPKIFQRFKKYEINTGIFLTQWFVCLFSQSLKYEMALVAWDHIILKGSVSLFKIGLVILDMLQANILKTEGLQIVTDIIEMASQLGDVQDFNKRINQIYISQKALNVLRDLYREIFFEELQTQQKIQLQKRKKIPEKPLCELKYPVCTHLLEEQKFVYSDPGFNIILSTGKSTEEFLIKDYFEKIDFYQKEKIQLQNLSKSNPSNKNTPNNFFHQSVQINNSYNSSSNKKQISSQSMYTYSPDQKFKQEQNQIIENSELQNQNFNNLLLIVRNQHVCLKQNEVVQQSNSKENSDKSSEKGNSEQNLIYSENILQDFEKSVLQQEKNEQNQQQSPNQNSFQMHFSEKPYKKSKEFNESLEQDEEENFQLEQLASSPIKLRDYQSRSKASSSINFIRKLSQKNMLFQEFIFDNPSLQKNSDKKKENILNYAIQSDLQD